MDKELHEIIQNYHDPRLIAREMNRKYDMTDATEDYYTLNGERVKQNIKEDIEDVLDKNIELDEIFKRRFHAGSFTKRKTIFEIPTKVEVHASNPNQTSLKLETANRKGLLYILSKVISDLNINITESRADTEGHDRDLGLRAVDTFTLTVNGKALNYGQGDFLEKSLTRLLNQETIKVSDMEDIKRVPKQTFLICLNHVKTF